jgi:hypothetical protein
MLVYAIVDERSSTDNPLGEVVDVRPPRGRGAFHRRSRGDAPELEVGRIERTRLRGCRADRAATAQRCHSPASGRLFAAVLKIDAGARDEVLDRPRGERRMCSADACSMPWLDTGGPAGRRSFARRDQSSRR